MLIVRHSLPSILDLGTCSAFPNREKLWMLSRRISTNSWPPSSQLFFWWTASSPSDLSPFLSCYLSSPQTCQSATHMVGDQKIFVEGRKEKRRKGKREENYNCLLHFLLHTVWSYKYINPDNFILKLTHHIIISSE